VIIPYINGRSDDEGSVRICWQVDRHYTFHVADVCLECVKGNVLMRQNDDADEDVLRYYSIQQICMLWRIISVASITA